MNNSILMLDEIEKDLPIGIAQIRVYLKDGRLKGKKVRNKWFVYQNDYEDFKEQYGFNFDRKETA